MSENEQKRYNGMRARDKLVLKLQIFEKITVLDER